MSLTYLNYLVPSIRPFIKPTREIGVNFYNLIHFPYYYENFHSLKNALDSSEIGRKIGETFLELSKMNYEKMNPDSSIYRFISKKAKLSSFLTKHSSKIEKVAKLLASFRFVTNRVPYFLKETLRYAAPILKIKIKNTKTLVKLGYAFAIGWDYFRNYRRTNNFFHASALTMVDQLEDFNFLTGMLIGAKVGSLPGAIVGMLAGFTNSFIKIIAPDFYSNLRKEVDSWFKKSRLQNRKTDPEYQINLKIIHERLLFYRKLVVNLNDTLMFVKKFRYDVHSYADSKSFHKLGEHRFQRLVEMIQDVRRDSQQLLSQLERFYLENQKLVGLEQGILGSDSDYLDFHDNHLAFLIERVEKMKEKYRQDHSYRYSYDLEKSYYWERLNDLKAVNYQLVTKIAKHLHQIYSQLQAIKKKGYFEGVITDFL